MLLRGPRDPRLGLACALGGPTGPGQRDERHGHDPGASVDRGADRHRRACLAASFGRGVHDRPGELVRDGGAEARAPQKYWPPKDPGTTRWDKKKKLEPTGL